MDFLPQLAQQGILGLLAAIEAAAIYFLWRDNRITQDKRVSDLLQARDAYLSSLESIKGTLDRVLLLIEEGRKSQ